MSDGKLLSDGMASTVQHVMDDLVAIIILNCNQWEYTRDCLVSLRQIDYRHFRVVLVDNGSSDSSLDRAGQDIPDVDYLRLPANLGVAGGRNAGLRRALASQPEYVLFLDNDTAVAPDFLTHLVARLKSDSGLGAVQPKIYFAEPADRICSAGGKLYPRISYYRHPGSGQHDGAAFANCRDIDIVSGCCALMRAEVFQEIGWLDETFGPYCHEDIDWSVRMKAAGYRLAFEPAARVWHRVPPRQQYSGGKLRELAKGHILFLRFHSRWFDRPASLLWITFHLIRRFWWPAFHRRDWKSVAAVFAGIRAGIRQPRLPIPRAEVHNISEERKIGLPSVAPRQRILLIGVLAPFDSGPSRVYKTLLESQFVERFRVTYLDLQFARDLSDFERLRLGKFLQLLIYLGRTAASLAGGGHGAMCIHLSTNRNAFLKDSLFAWLGFLFHIPVIVLEHGTHVPALYERSGAALRWFMRSTLRRVSRFVVLADNLKFNFEAFVPAERITSVHLGIPPQAELPERSKFADEKCFRILYLSALLRLKGPLTLIEALARIRRKRSDFFCTLAGGWGSDAATMQAAILQSIAHGGLEKFVSRTGAVAGRAKQNLWADSDLFVFPTLSDSYGIVLLEAMRAGLPIVASRSGAIPEIIADGINGLLCAPGDADDLAEKITYLMERPALRDSMAENNRRRFDEFFTAEKFAGRMAEVFDAVLTEASGASRHPAAAEA